MRCLGLVALLILGACVSLDADFESDAVGARPAARPPSQADDRIEFSPFSFQGQVVPYATGALGHTGQRAFEMSGNSWVRFVSADIPPGQQASRHRVSFFFQDGTTRGKTITLRGAGQTLARLRLADGTLGFRTTALGPDEEFSITPLRLARVTLVIDPVTGTTTMTYTTSAQSITTSAPIGAPGTIRIDQMSLRFDIDQVQNFPRGRVTIDDVYARWAPRITLGAPS